MRPSLSEPRSRTTPAVRSAWSCARTKPSMPVHAGHRDVDLGWDSQGAGRRGGEVIVGADRPLAVYVFGDDVTQCEAVLRAVSLRRMRERACPAGRAALARL